MKATTKGRPCFNDIKADEAKKIKNGDESNE